VTLKWLAALAPLALGVLVGGCGGSLGSVDGTGQTPARATFVVNGTVVGSDQGQSRAIQITNGTTGIDVVVQGTSASVVSASSLNPTVATASVVNSSTVRVVPINIGRATIRVTLSVPARSRQTEQFTNVTVDLIVDVLHPETHAQGGGSTF